MAGSAAETLFEAPVDANGALTHITTEDLRSVPPTIKTTELVYDVREKMVEIRLPDGRKIANEYYPSPEWARLFLTAPDGPKTFQVWDPRTGNPAQDLDAAGATVAEYLMGNRMDEALALSSGAGLHAYLTDERESVRNLVTAVGVAVNRSTYAAFGVPRLEQLTVADRLRWTAREWEPAVVLQHNRWRNYLPHIGRWTLRDPLGHLGGVNLYLYGGANPVMNIDPLGLTCTLEKEEKNKCVKREEPPPCSQEEGDCIERKTVCSYVCGFAVPPKEIHIDPKESCSQLYPPPDK